MRGKWENGNEGKGGGGGGVQSASRQYPLPSHHTAVKEREKRKRVMKTCVAGLFRRAQVQLLPDLDALLDKAAQYGKQGCQHLAVTKNIMVLYE